MVPGSKGPRYLKVIFKYELDSKEGPSCYFYFLSETSPFNSPEDRTTVTNADFIQTGLINLKSQSRDDFCLQTMYPEAVVGTNSNEDFQIIQEILPTTLMEESMPLIFSDRIIKRPSRCKYSTRLTPSPSTSS